jgi:hypothetical protein
VPQIEQRDLPAQQQRTTDLGRRDGSAGHSRLIAIAERDAKAHRNAGTVVTGA